jgi:Phage integrase family
VLGEEGIRSVRSVTGTSVPHGGSVLERPEHALLAVLVRLGQKSSGRVFKTRYIKTAYNNAVDAAQLDDVTFHTLRHTFASWAVMRGVTLRELQELLGHSSLAMTMRYAHLVPEPPPDGSQAAGRPHQYRARLSFSASLSARACRDRGSVSEVAEVVGSPGWSRTATS